MRPRLQRYLVHLGLVDLNDGVEDARPLQNMAFEMSSGPASFKEVWQPDQALKCLVNQGIYEAGASLMWAVAIPISDPAANIPFSEPSLQEVRDLSTSAWCRTQIADKRFRIFPRVLQAHQTPGVANLRYPRALQLLIDHAYVCAWWLAVYFALKNADDADMQLLVEAALCTTISLRILRETDDVIIATIMASESTKAFSACRSFAREVSYEELAHRVDILTQFLVPRKPNKHGSHQPLSAQQVFFQLKEQYPTLKASAFTVALVKSIKAINRVFPLGSKARLLLRRLELIYGNRVMGNFTQQHTFCVLISKVAQNMHFGRMQTLASDGQGLTAPQLAEGMLVLLLHDLATPPNELTTDLIAVDGSRGLRSEGLRKWVLVAASKFILADYLMNGAARCANLSDTNMDIPQQNPSRSLSFFLHKQCIWNQPN